jgi:hypothetical protein
MKEQERKKWLAYCHERKAIEAVKTLARYYDREDIVEADDHVWQAKYREPDIAVKKLPDMPFTVTGEAIYTSPEDIAWIREDFKDMELVRLLAPVKTLTDAEKREAYVFLAGIPNKAPIYERDSVFAIAWEAHYKNLGKRGIVRELATTRWMIRHLGLHGFKKQWAIEKLQGVLKTNKINAMFHSETIDDMIINREAEIAHDEKYGVTESDYSRSFGESVNPAQLEANNGVAVSLEDREKADIYAYLDGLNKLIKARIERYVDMGMYTFISGDDFKGPIPTVNNFNKRLYRGYLKHQGLTVTDSLLSKRAFLTYVYTYYRPINAYSDTGHYTNSVDWTHGKLTHTWVSTEKIREVSEIRETIAIVNGDTITRKSGKVNRPLIVVPGKESAVIRGNKIVTIKTHKVELARGEK